MKNVYYIKFMFIEKYNNISKNVVFINIYFFNSFLYCFFDLSCYDFFLLFSSKNYILIRLLTEYEIFLETNKK